MIRRWRPQALMSTFPMASAHLIGHTLQRLSGLPWVADFRDNMTEPGYPPDPRMYRFNVRLESDAVHRCTRALFTTRGALQMYAGRYPDVPPGRWAVIENGYDEENFSRAETGLAAPVAATTDAPLRLIHSGILYPAERDPTAFFTAVARLKSAGAIDARRLQIVLRATGSDAFYAPRLAAAGIDDIVRLAPPVGYEEALREMLQADGLLLFQAAMANHQIPAKLYEYMRAGRPILALTDPAGDTAAAMRAAHTGVICTLADADDITRQLQAFVDGLRSGRVQGTARAEAGRHSRRARTAELAALLDEVATAG
ncbi:MAG: glycosyltransferase [Rubrivivax sp.]